MTLFFRLNQVLN